VPDGTSALVRCPACKTVFAPADGLASEPEPDDEPRPKKPAKKPAPEAKPDENRDFDPSHFEDKPKKRRRRRFDETDDDSLSIEERRSLRAAFTRAAWGCRLIWISFSCFMLSMLIIVAFWFQGSWLVALEPTYVTVAGLIGVFTWLTGAIGVGLCLSGPPSPGHWGYGIAAAVATFVHIVMLSVLVGKGTDYSIGKEAEPVGSNAKWGLVPTRLDAVALYVTLMIYHDEEVVPKGDLRLSIIVGVFEMIRNLLILMLLSCLARATGDEDVSHQCTRAAGFASVGPGAMAVILLLFAIAMVETNAQNGDLGKILLATVRMWTYAFFIGTTISGFAAAQATADACDEPYQSRLPQL